MKNKVIRNVSELPSWFRENIYPEISDEISWAIEIKRRLRLWNLVYHPDPLKHNIEDDEEGVFKGDHIMEFLLPSVSFDDRWFDKNRNIIDCPLILQPFEIKRPVDHMWGWDLAHLTAAAPEDIVPHIQSIRNLLALDDKYHYSKNDWNAENRDYCLKRDATLDKLGESITMATAATSFLDKTPNPYRSLSFFVSGRPCMVDISQDDETLISSFLNWVKNERESQNVAVRQRKSPLNREVLKGWNRFKPLQVFDLDLWSKINSVKITDSVISKALWTEEDDESMDIDPISRLRNVTRKNTIPAIISDDMLNRLLGLISDAIAKTDT